MRSLSRPVVLVSPSAHLPVVRRRAVAVFEDHTFPQQCSNFALPLFLNPLRANRERQSIEEFVHPSGHGRYYALEQVRLDALAVWLHFGMPLPIEPSLLPPAVVAFLLPTIPIVARAHVRLLRER